MTAPALVWYAAYGSNMWPERLGCYLRGGRPPGSLREYPGCRDPSPPARSAPVTVPGALYFATESAVWTGGRAFLDPDAGGETPAVAHLLTVEQFADIAAQEMGRAGGGDLDPLALLGASDRARLGPGRYETLVRLGASAGVPVLTLTAPWGVDTHPGNAPAAAYLRMLGRGLMAGHGWPADRAAGYLADRPGARGYWTPEGVRRVLTEAEPGS
ncbi:histone deacetylase [Streptomyces sp. 3MP-14]|uniref:Histone deacetylase n=1 Tax=Streptomyces mimosae TaxID=2586635 RepID=A0A5N6A5Z5_9ACTN|nr:MULTISPECIES: histone deacetylase [Streptomyces]KAB8163805.1 histone deacetylase [Streptomyces mimosae]KAB8175248.1 histone deacetylase [Streptomyces sp. 3MP-14]